MKLYHGTSLASAKSIEKHGIKAIPAIEGLPEAGCFIYLSQDRDLSKSYGEAVFEVETDDLDASKLETYQECIGLIHNYSEDIPPELIKRL